MSSYNHNHFEIAQLRDGALVELNVPETTPPFVVRRYAAELLKAALASDSELMKALAVVKELCVANGYQRDLYDFYLLYFAYEDLQCSEMQWYWKCLRRRRECAKLT